MFASGGFPAARSFSATLKFAAANRQPLDVKTTSFFSFGVLRLAFCL